MKNFITKDQSAQFFECGYDCDNALFLQIKGDKHFITDGRYEEEAKQFLKDTQLHITHNLQEVAANLLQNYTKRIRKSLEIIYDPSELSCLDFTQIFSSLPLNKLSLKAEIKFHQFKRIRKTPEEIALLEESQRCNLKAFSKIAKFIQKKGLDKSEQRLHFRAKNILEKKGEFDLSFNPIVGINANAAKPHALPSSEDFLKDGDLVLVDAGIKWKRYCSDCTRTGYFTQGSFKLKKQQFFKNKEMQKIYDIVLKAQETAILGTRSGMLGREIDSLAREVIKEAGYGEYFVHSLGHGIGIDIHELPNISQRSEIIIEDGMVFSIEPGIYIPNAFGVRIEDLVVMENGKARILGSVE